MRKADDVQHVHAEQIGPGRPRLTQQKFLQAKQQSRRQRPPRRAASWRARSGRAAIPFCRMRSVTSATETPARKRKSGAGSVPPSCDKLEEVRLARGAAEPGVVAVRLEHQDAGQAAHPVDVGEALLGWSASRHVPCATLRQHVRAIACCGPGLPWARWCGCSPGRGIVRQSGRDSERGASFAATAGASLILLAGEIWLAAPAIRERARCAPRGTAEAARCWRCGRSARTSVRDRHAAPFHGGALGIAAAYTLAPLALAASAQRAQARRLAGLRGHAGPGAADQARLASRHLPLP